MSIEEAILLDTLRCRLDFLRTKNNYTKKEVAERLNLPFEQYETYESGESLPHILELMDVADLYQTTLDYLVGKTEN
ncbi:helix-turn-helix domain-containing protein [Enterococcus sp. AZ007]|uniref:helix-turn-helix domain-containing protein n=1 Tax=Enterococcus sp. AZ007 TaxID=2774839 RepID=UPI003F22F606